MPDQPMYVWDPICRKHVRRRQYTAHAAIYHPQTPAAERVPAPAPPPVTKFLHELKGERADGRTSEGAKDQRRGLS